MATYDRTYGTATHQSATESRFGRRLHLDWSAILGGTALGWGALLLLSLIGISIGFAAIDPYAVRPQRTAGLGSAIWGGAAMMLTASLGSYFVVRLAGDRRRNESLLHGAVSWGLSMIAGALIALAAASSIAAAAGPTAARRAGPRDRVTNLDRARLDDASTAGARTAGIAAGAALFALVGSLFGALIGASRQSGVSLKNEFRLDTLGFHPKRTGKPHAGEHPASVLTPDDLADRRETTTILPPTH